MALLSLTMSHCAPDQLAALEQVQSILWTNKASFSMAVLHQKSCSWSFFRRKRNGRCSIPASDWNLIGDAEDKDWCE